MYLTELVQQSWTAIRRNRMRSVLTMLGIAWGVVSVVLLLAFGEGLGGGITRAVGNMGNNVIVLWPGQTSMQAGGQRAPNDHAHHIARNRADGHANADLARALRDEVREDPVDPDR